MQRTKTYFEQIPVEAVKKIATELPETNDDGVSLETKDKGMSSPEAWRQLAQQIQQESDPAKMGELVQQLLDALDSRESA